MLTATITTLLLILLLGPASSLPVRDPNLNTITTALTINHTPNHHDHAPTIYQTANFVPKHPNSEHSTPQPMIGTTSQRQNPSVDVTEETTGQINEEHQLRGEGGTAASPTPTTTISSPKEAKEEEKEEDKHTLPCHHDVKNPDYTCDNEEHSVAGDSAGGVGSVPTFPVCTWDERVGEYVCEGGKAAGDVLVARQFPGCYFDPQRGEYVCEGGKATARLVARQFPSCYFDARRGEYVCDGKPVAEN